MNEYLQFPAKQFLEKMPAVKVDEKGTSPFVNKKGLSQ